MQSPSLNGKSVLITGSARRVGRALALAVARAGADVIIHHAHSPVEAEEAASQIREMGREAWVLQADLEDLREPARLIQHAFEIRPLYALVNSAAIFEPLDWSTTTQESWQRHLAINLSAPFFLSQAFAKSLGTEAEGRIVNINDWRALRPGADHLPYTISKAGLTAVTRSLAISLAPRIQVNGLALGAILPPSSSAVSVRSFHTAPPDAKQDPILKYVPAERWAELDEVGEALIFLLSGPSYITGEIIHVDGGRHLI